MSGQIYEDERHLFIGDIEGLSIGGGHPAADMVLHLPVVQGGDELLDQVNLAAVFGLGIGQVVQHPQVGVEFLHRFIWQLDHTSKLSPQQLRLALGEESVLVFIQDFLDHFWPCEVHIHDGLQGGVLHVNHGFGFFVTPPIELGNYLKLGTPCQEILSREIPKVPDLGVIRPGHRREVGSCCALPITLV